MLFGRLHAFPTIVDGYDSLLNCTKAAVRASDAMTASS